MTTKDPTSVLRVVLLRHGKAETDSPTGRDADRRLRPRGERQARWMGEQLARHGPVHLVLHSPLVRAVETARLVNDLVRAPMRLEPRLSTDHNARDIVAVVNSLDTQGTVVLVGHNPELSSAGGLLAREIEPAKGELRTGEAWVIAMHEALGTLEAVWRLDEED